MKDSREWIIEYENNPYQHVTPEWVRSIQDDATAELEQARAQLQLANIDAANMTADLTDARREIARLEAILTEIHQVAKFHSGTSSYSVADSKLGRIRALAATSGHLAPGAVTE